MPMAHTVSHHYEAECAGDTEREQSRADTVFITTRSIIAPAAFDCSCARFKGTVRKLVVYIRKPAV